VWSAYVAIPCVLAYFVLRKRDVPFRTIFWLFGAFILACGTTHLMEAILFWWPAYRLAGVIKLFTAVVSWGTVLALVPVMPKALAMRSPEELGQEITARRKAEDALHQTNAELEMRVQERTAELARANAALRYEREMLHITLASIGDGVIATDIVGRVKFLNPVAESLTGWKQDEAGDVSLGTVFNIINEQSRQPINNPFSRTLREGTVVGLVNHTVLIAKDASERPIESSAAPIRDQDGRIAGVVVVVRDITGRRREENERRRRVEQLAEAEERTRAVVNTVIDGIITIDEAATIQSLNPAAEKLFGYQTEEVVGQNVKMLMPEPYHGQHDGYVANYLRTGQAKIIGIGREVVGRRKDASTFPMELAVSEFRLGEGRYFTGIVRDITQRKQAEEALRCSEAQFRQVADAMPQMVWTARPDGYLDYYDERWYEYTGFPRGEFGQQSWEPILHPDDVQRCVDTYFGCIKAERPYQIEYRFKDRKTGGFRWFLGRAMPVRDERGRIVRWLGTCTDIDDTKKAQEVLKEADRRKDEFLATLAHELRNPLAPIRNSIELLRREDGNADLIGQARKIMERQLGLMVRLVDDLLDISRITRGKIQLRKERVELATVVQSAVEECRPLIEAQSHELTVTLPPDPICLEADPIRLGQVVANLLTNAAKYTEKGGRLWLTAERQGGEVMVSVRDTGIGIAAEHLPHIFEMFSQLTPALERSHGGLGIGLALVKGLVELHEGTVEARSPGPGKGSEFIVRLPVATTSVPPRQEPSVDGEKSRVGPKRRILIADDVRDTVDSLAMMLRLAGHELQTAYDGLEAVQTAATFRPDVVLLDIGLPKMNGYEAAGHIRAQPWGKGTVLIAITGWGQDEDKRRAMEAGFDHHLTKPVEPAALEKLLTLITPMPQQ